MPELTTISVRLSISSDHQAHIHPIAQVTICNRFLLLLVLEDLNIADCLRL